LRDGAHCAVAEGYGGPDDLSYMEEDGRLATAGADLISDRALERGLGYQTYEDSLKVMNQAMPKYNITLPDRQLACTPIQSPEGQDYLAAMAAAANYAWAIRAEGFFQRVQDVQIDQAVGESGKHFERLERFELFERGSLI
jgi:RNA-splicing ligase RtcB